MDPLDPLLGPEEDPADDDGRVAGPEGRAIRGGRAPGDVEELRVRDGARIWVRPIRPEDAQRMVQGLSWLSDRSIYFRFHTHLRHLSASQLAYLTDVDHHDHEAVIAIDPDTEGQPGVAVARYIRTVEDRTIAEAAVTVIDAYHGRGIGTAMIRHLEGLAHERGIRTFRNYVLAENTAMLEVFANLGSTVEREAPGVHRVDIPVLPPEEGERPLVDAVTALGRQAAERLEGWAYPVVWAVRQVAGMPGRAGEGSLLEDWAEEATDGSPPPEGEG